MVVRLCATDRTALWIEVEPRSYIRDSYRSLIFSAAGAMPALMAFKRLLAVVAERAGVWPPQAALRPLVAVEGQSRIAACAGWEHTRLKPVGNIPVRLWPLSGNAALAEIQKVLKS